MPLLTRFDTPAFLKDVPDGSSFYKNWSAFISELTGNTKKGDGGGAYYNPAKVDVNNTAEKMMTWMGFPRQLMLKGASSADRSVVCVVSTE